MNNLEQDCFIEVGYSSSNDLDGKSFDVGVSIAERAVKSIKKYKISVVIVFASVYYDLNELLSGISNVVGDVTIIGSTTAGEIYDGCFNTNTAIITVMASPYLKVHNGIGREVSKDHLASVDEAVKNKDVESFFNIDNYSFWKNFKRSGSSVFGLLFSPGNTKSADSHSYGILESLRQRSGAQFPICGGSSADDWNMDTNFIFYNGHAYPDSMLIAIFETQLQYGIGMNHGFFATNRRAAVTRAEKHEIFELNDKRADRVFASLFDKSVEELQGKHLTLDLGKPVGFATPHGAYNINVASYFTENGGIRFAQPVHKNTVLTIMDAHPDGLISSGAIAAKQALLNGNIVDGALSIVFSCALRKCILGDKISEEFKKTHNSLKKIPMLGFMSFGEQGINIDGENRHGNEMVCVLVLGKQLTPAAEIYLENKKLLQKQEVVLQKIKESNNKYQSIVNNISLGVALISRKMEILELNRTMQEWFPGTDLTKKKLCYNIFNKPPRDEICQSCPTHKTLQDGKIHETTVNKDYGNGIRSFRIIASPIIDEKGKVKAAIEIVEDITARLRLEKQIRQTQKMESIGTLAGGIAHDFNNLLTPIVGYSEVLLNILSPEQREFEYGYSILKSALRGRDLVKQILAFSHQSEKTKTPVKIQHILFEVLKLSRSTIPMNIEITKNIQQSFGMVQIDPTQLHQLIINMMTNAYHAVEQKENAKISVELKETTLGKEDVINLSIEPGKYAELTFTDNGCGIDSDIIKKIFDPYFTTKDVGKGTGLGLAVVHGIVKGSGGDISVISESGKGTTFTIYFPLTPIERKNHKSNLKLTEYKTGSERILLVDDEDNIVKINQIILEKLGYQVTPHTNSEDALNAFKANPEGFDLVITDMSMPHKTGIQLAKELFKFRPNIPVIICTGFSEQINHEIAKNIGIKGFLMKPIERKDMADMIRNVLD